MTSARISALTLASLVSLPAGTGSRITALTLGGTAGGGTRVVEMTLSGTAAAVAPTVTLSSLKSGVEAGALILLNAVASTPDDITTYTFRVISTTNSIPAPLLEAGGDPSQRLVMAPPSTDGTVVTFGVKVTNGAGLTSSEVTYALTVAAATEFHRLGGVMVPIAYLIQLPGGTT